MNSIQCAKCGCIITIYSCGLSCCCGNIYSVEFIDDSLIIKAKDNKSVYILDKDGGRRFINED